jgi:hypothetical protein
MNHEEKVLRLVRPIWIECGDLQSIRKKLTIERGHTDGPLWALAMLVRFRDSLRDAVAWRKEYRAARKAKNRALMLRAAVEVEVAELTGCLLQSKFLPKGLPKQTNLRRGEKCVSLRHTARPVSVTTGPGAAVHSKRRREDK